uniref:Uncharacterized protein n=1 Tax=Candidatus Kentrum sp. LFY TaxID=2126342 RepID=A0A450WKL2_9GAMM|nr:MAG: hypothetical protein BECKLFY1418C_GA0070996_10334 [Candidatus Kentron sp. LFY]
MIAKSECCLKKLHTEVTIGNSVRRCLKLASHSESALNFPVFSWHRFQVQWEKFTEKARCELRGRLIHKIGANHKNLERMNTARTVQQTNPPR